MRFESFNGTEFLMMMIGSANLLAIRRSEIDALNVFPVPDGDTGTNMYHTFLAGVSRGNSRRHGPGMSSGSQREFRGNTFTDTTWFCRGAGRQGKGVYGRCRPGLRRGDGSCLQVSDESRRGYHAYCLQEAFSGLFR